MKKLLTTVTLISTVVLINFHSYSQSPPSDNLMEKSEISDQAKKHQYYYKIEDLPETMLIPEDNIKTRFLLTDDVLVSFIEVPAGAVFPQHAHDAAQILIVLEGEEHHEINGEKFVMRAGDVAVHPAGVIHGGSPGPNGFKGIDIFTPPRKSHVKLMEEQGTLPNEFGEYKKVKE